jgi:lipopolysaccharide export system protein LptA
MTKIRFATYFLISLVLTTLLLAGDNMFHLIHADKSTGQVINGERIRILSGHIVAYQDTLRMYCDEATFYEDRAQIIFIGNVLIFDGHHKLWADKILYFTDLRYAECYGHVRIGGVNDSLYAEKFVYQFRERNAEGEHNLFIRDKQNDVSIWGDAGKYIYASRYSMVTGHARFRQISADQKDTLLITAKKLEYHAIPPKRAYALERVNIYKDQVKATCDSATYLIPEELVKLRVNPLAWQDQNEMSGKAIDLHLDSLKINQININEKAHLKSVVDSTQKKYNHLRGKAIQIELQKGEPQRVLARYNATSVYVIMEDSLNQGTNSSSSDSILVFFKTGEIDSIAIIGGIEGIFYPADYKGEIKGEQ